MLVVVVVVVVVVAKRETDENEVPIRKIHTLRSHDFARTIALRAIVLAATNVEVSKWSPYVVKLVSCEPLVIVASVAGRRCRRAKCC